jgi:hypothetical protein
VSRDFAAGLSREQERKQLMGDEGVDYANPAEREAWEDENTDEATCQYCRKDIKRLRTAPDDSDLSMWRDDWDDAECDSPDGEHHPQGEDAIPPNAISHADVLRILADVRARYAAAGRGDEDIFRVLENRLVPLTPGEPVWFQRDFQRRWLKGVYVGPVANPGDPHRKGDVVVHPTARSRASWWPDDQVFLSSVQRREDAR